MELWHFYTPYPATQKKNIIGKKKSDGDQKIPPLIDSSNERREGKSWHSWRGDDPVKGWPVPPNLLAVRTRILAQESDVRFKL